MPFVYSISGGDEAPSLRPEIAAKDGVIWIWCADNFVQAGESKYFKGIFHQVGCVRLTGHLI